MMLMVSYGWTARQIERRIERQIHVFLLVSVLVLALVPLFLGGYNPSVGICSYPNPLPIGCGNWLRGDGVTECLRGSDTLATVYFAICILSAVATTTFCTGAMAVIYRSVYRQDQTMAKYSRGNSQKEAYAMSRSIRTKMLLYTSTFYISWILPLVFIYTPGSPPALWLVGHALFPLMGFLNMLVFILPKCRKHQKLRPGTRLPTAYVHVLLAAPLAESWRRATARTASATAAGDGTLDARTPAAGPSLWAVDADVEPTPRGVGAGPAFEEATAGAAGGGGDAPAVDAAPLLEETA